MFHDWIEVTKKNEKGKIDSCNALRFIALYIKLCTSDVQRHPSPIFIVDTNKKLNGSRVFRKGFDG